MRTDGEWRALLASELQPAEAPSGLWDQVHARLEEPLAPVRTGIWRVHPLLAFSFAAIVLLLLAPARWIRPANWSNHTGALDLEAYLAPVQNASAATSAPAIYRAPPHFESVPRDELPVSLAGYRVAAQRRSTINGEPVKQIILAVADSVVALFIASPKVRLNTGENQWIDENLEGISCKRLNCKRTRAFQFPCSKETCVLVCKACSETAMRALISQVVLQSPDFR